MLQSNVLVNVFNACIDNCNFAIILQYMYEHPYDFLEQQRKTQKQTCYGYVYKQVIINMVYF